MPELPEVETIARGLVPHLNNQQFVDVVVCGHTMFDESPKTFSQRLRRRQITRLWRHGKSIFISFEGQPTLFLRIHLGMSGQLLWSRHDAPRKKHTHVIFDTGDPMNELRYVDARRFGWMELLTGLPKLLVPDAWLSTDDENFKALRERRGLAKNILLGQKAIAGLGNIYVDESLYRAKIHPRQKLEKISDSQLRMLCKSIRHVLAKSIGVGGTSFRDYVDISGGRGGFKKRLSIYGKTGHTCSCGSAFKKIVVASRGTHFCPTCQSLSRTRKNFVSKGNVCVQ